MKIRWFSHVPVMLEKGTLGFLGFLEGGRLLRCFSQLGTPEFPLVSCWVKVGGVFLRSS